MLAKAPTGETRPLLLVKETEYYYFYKYSIFIIKALNTRQDFGTWGVIILSI